VNVEFSPGAAAQAEKIAAWWAANRLAAPLLFLDELDAAIEQLARAPETGRIYEPMERLGIRRVLMPRSRYHVYYSVDHTTAVIRIHAVWHASRGAAPSL